MSFGAVGSAPQRPSHSRIKQGRSSRGSETADETSSGTRIDGGAEAEAEAEDEDDEEEVGPSLVQRLAFALLAALLALLVAFAVVGLKPDMQVAADSAPFVGAVAMFVGMFVSEQEWASAYVRRMPGQ